MNARLVPTAETLLGKRKIESGEIENKIQKLGALICVSTMQKTKKSLLNTVRISKKDSLITTQTTLEAKKKGAKSLPFMFKNIRLLPEKQKPRSVNPGFLEMHYTKLTIYVMYHIVLFFCKPMGSL